MIENEGVVDAASRALGSAQYGLHELSLLSIRSRFPEN